MKLIQHGIAIVLALFISTTVWAEDAGPRAVIEQTVGDIIKALEERTDTTRISVADREAISKTVEGRFDYRNMARRSLGKPWKKLDDAEREHFTKVFRELLERSYGNRLSEYKGQKVVFADAVIKKKKTRTLAVVKSTVIDGTRETPVEYRMHLTDSGWQVYDIRIEGTSMVRTFHQDFKGTLKNGGYEALVTILEEKIAKLKSKDEG